jgi:ATP-dependent Lhr-like helicase
VALRQRRPGASRGLLGELRRPSPLSFPRLVDRTREQASSAKLADRVRRMTAGYERAARR